MKQPPPEEPVEFIRLCLVAGRVRWTYHVMMRLQQRSLSMDMLLHACQSLEIVETYPDDKYLPSYLLRCEWDETVFHAHIATDVSGENIRVVTMYMPHPDEWEDGFRRRIPTK